MIAFFSLPNRRVKSEEGTARIYDGDYELVSEITLGATDGTSFINDVVVTDDYAYFTDSFQSQFYAVRRCEIPTDRGIACFSCRDSNRRILWNIMGGVGLEYNLLYSRGIVS